jgi:hypothetical protein
LANFQFESSDALLNWPRDEQNCKHKRDSATGYSEDHNVMVCKKHGVPSDALLRGVLIPKWGGSSSDPPPLARHDPGSSSRAVYWNASGGFFVPFTTHAPQRTFVVEACMSSGHELNEFGLLLDQFHAVVREGSDTIEDIFDAEFRRRFSELINRVAEPDRPDPEDLRKFHR